MMFYEFTINSDPNSGRVLNSLFAYFVPQIHYAINVVRRFSLASRAGNPSSWKSHSSGYSDSVPVKSGYMLLSRSLPKRHRVSARELVVRSSPDALIIDDAGEGGKYFPRIVGVGTSVALLTPMCWVSLSRIANEPQEKCINEGLRCLLKELEEGNIDLRGLLYGLSRLKNLALSRRADPLDFAALIAGILNSNEHLSAILAEGYIDYLDGEDIVFSELAYIILHLAIIAYGGLLGVLKRDLST